LLKLKTKATEDMEGMGIISCSLVSDKRAGRSKSVAFMHSSSMSGDHQLTDIFIFVTL
jgi:hypothetical protein